MQYDALFVVDHYFIGLLMHSYVIEPYYQYPNLLDILLNFLKTEQTQGIKREVHTACIYLIQSLSLSLSSLSLSLSPLSLSLSLPLSLPPSLPLSPSLPPSLSLPLSLSLSLSLPLLAVGDTCVGSIGSSRPSQTQDTQRIQQHTHWNAHQ